MNKFKYLLLVTIPLLTSTAYAWTINKNWEDVKSPPGTMLHQDDAQYFQDFGNRRVFVTDQGRSGKAVEMRIAAPYINGSKGQTVWAGGIGIGTGDKGYMPKEGEEIWGRAYVYFSPNWSWNPAKGSGLKIIRLFPSKVYDGELIVQVDGNGKSYGMTQNFTGGNIELYYSSGKDGSGLGSPYPIGKWFALEAYMKQSSNPNIARVRVWIDGVLVLNRGGNDYGYTNRQTFKRSGSQIILGSPGIILFSTWDVDGSQSGPTLPNGAQFARFDDIIVTNDPLVAKNTDASGNKMIGVSGVSPAPTPTSTPAVTPVFVNCKCNTPPSMIGCTKVPNTARKYSCPTKCPTSCTPF